MIKWWVEWYFEYVCCVIKRYKKMLIFCAILLMEICSGVELPMVSGEY